MRIDSYWSDILYLFVDIDPQNLTVDANLNDKKKQVFIDVK